MLQSSHNSESEALGTLVKDGMLQEYLEGLAALVDYQFSRWSNRNAICQFSYKVFKIWPRSGCHFSGTQPSAFLNSIEMPLCCSKECKCFKRFSRQNVLIITELHCRLNLTNFSFSLFGWRTKSHKVVTNCTSLIADHKNCGGRLCKAPWNLKVLEKESPELSIVLVSGHEHIQSFLTLCVQINKIKNRLIVKRTRRVRFPAVT